MTVTTLATQNNAPQITAIEAALIGGDLSQLNPQARVQYYNEICRSLGLNALTKPFAYITLNGKLTLYALRDAGDQLRKINGVSITEMVPELISDLFVVKVKAVDRDGRTDAATGAVNIKGLAGEALANAMMKAETKAKRRVTLSLCGLGFLDETEVDTLRDQGIAKEPLMTADSFGNMVPVKPAPAKVVPPKETLTEQLQGSLLDMKPKPLAPSVGPDAGMIQGQVFIDTITYHETKPSAKSKGGKPYAIIHGLHAGDDYYVWDTTFFAAAEANKGRTLTLKTEQRRKFMSITGGLEPIDDDINLSTLETEADTDRTPF
jgi:hypothetical protein